VACLARGRKRLTDMLLGLLSLLEHPANGTLLAMLLAGNGKQGLASAARLFPVRTGVPVPDWSEGSYRVCNSRE
jgi:hypothetical protein